MEHAALRLLGVLIVSVFGLRLAERSSLMPTPKLVLQALIAAAGLTYFLRFAALI